MTKSIKSQLISLADAMSLTGFTKVTIGKLVADGFLTREGRGVFRLGDLVQAVMNHLRAQKKNAAQTVETKRIQTARAEEIEQRTRRAADQLWEQEDVFAFVDKYSWMLLRKIEGMPAALTRDLELRKKMEDWLNVMRTEFVEELKKDAEIARRGEHFHEEETGVDDEA